MGELPHGRVRPHGPATPISPQRQSAWAWVEAGDILGMARNENAFTSFWDVLTGRRGDARRAAVTGLRFSSNDP